MKLIKRSLLTTFFLATAAASTANAATDVNSFDDIKNVLANGIESSVNVINKIQFVSQLGINSDFTISVSNKNEHHFPISADKVLNDVAIRSNAGTLAFNSVIFEKFDHGVVSSAVDSVVKTDNAIFRKNNKDGVGGVIESAGALNVANSGFVKNTATGNGGAINSSNESTIHNSYFNNNTSTDGNGGAVFAKDKLVVTDSTFTGNSAEDAGGAINSSKELSVKYSLFKNNTSETGNGGAINSTGVLDVRDSRFIKNSSELNGGALNLAGKSDVLNSLFKGNSSENGVGGAISNTGQLAVYDSRLLKNEAKGNGGAINHKSATSSDVLTVRNSLFEDNISKEGNGGALASAGTAYIIDSNVRRNTGKYGGAVYSQSGHFGTENSVYEYNKASNGGGAIFNSGASSLQVKNGTFTGNTVVNEIAGSVSGGAIYNAGYSYGIDGTFTENSVKNASSSFGGAIYNGGANAHVKSITGLFEGNSVETDYGFAYGGAITNYTYGATIDKIDAKFVNNSAKSNGTSAARGGAIFNLGEISEISGVFSRNYTKSDGVSQGGAIYNAVLDDPKYNTQGYVKVVDATFFKNGRNQKNEIMTSEGGAIYNADGATLKIDASKFTKNAATDAGGAIFNEGGEVTVYNSTFKKNTSKGNGGAIYSEGDTADTFLYGNTFLRNKATTDGGAIFNAAGTMEIQKTLFKKNTAENGTGGAIHNERGAEVRLFGSKFNSNKAQGNGGAIDNAGKLVVSSLGNGEEFSVFKNNVSKTGSGGAIHNTGDLYVQQAIFENNSAAVNGGAINNYFTNGLTMRDSLFEGNTATGSGGALYNAATTTHILGSTFTGNEAKEGGAINQRSGYLNISASDISDNAAVFTDNFASSLGGAIYSSVTSKLNVDGALFARNSAVSGGGAIYNVGTAYNIIGEFTENSAVGYGGAIYNRGNRAIVDYIGGTFNGNFVQNDTGYYALGGAIANIADGAVIKEINANFANNYALSNGNADAKGGAIMNQGEISNLSGVFSHNYTESNGKSQGGAIYNEKSYVYIPTKGYLKVTDSKFLNNGIRQSDDMVMTKQGGAIYNYNNGAVLEVEGSYFEGNAATLAGGAIYNNLGNAVISGSDFSSNKALENGGAAIYNNGGEVTVSKSNFFNNEAGQYGGAIFNNAEGKLNVSEAFFSFNKAGLNGGAINNVSGSELDVANSVFISNTAVDGKGGAINNVGTATITDSYFVGNEATNGLGGAISNEGDLTIKALDGYVAFALNKDSQGESNAIHNYASGTINMLAAEDKVIFIADKITGNGDLNVGSQSSADNVNYDGWVVINEDTSGYTGAVTLNSGTLKLAGLLGKDTNVFSDFTVTGGTLDTANLFTNKIDASQWNVLGQLGAAIDVNLNTEEADYFSGVGYKDIAITDITLIDRLRGYSNEIDVAVADKDNAMSLAQSASEAYGLVFAYDVTSDKLQSDGLLTFNRNGLYNPLVLKAKAALSGHLVNISDAIKNTFAPKTRTSLANLASGEQTNSLFASAWVESYYASDDVDLNGSEINSDSYFTIIGGDIKGKNLGAWTSLYSVYTGYTGSHQTQSDYRIDQDGIILGGSLTLEKDNLYTITNANVSTSFAKSKTSTGDDNFNMYSFSIANKSGAKFDVVDKLLTFEPSIAVGYHYIHTEDYRASNSVNVESDGLSIFNIVPELKFGLDIEGPVKPYVAAAYNWNIDAGGDVTANGILLPTLSVDKYAEVKFGIDVELDNGMGGYTEVQGSFGDRDGYGIQIGIKWDF